jgi:tRNA U34 5-carboxymethylaminomethyl modifying enzyme MnmG/GidA
MKAITLLTGILILTFNCSLAQDLSAEDRKVQIFTYEEKANLQTWYNEELQRMNFSEEEESQYNSILYYYIAKIARLDDKDQDFTEAEFKAKLNEYLAKQEADLKEILSPEQMDIHRDIYGEFLRSAYRRWGIEQ